MIQANDKLKEMELLHIYDLIFSSVHSAGFKMAEIKDLLFDNTYWFLEQPKENWKDDLFKYLDEINFNKSQLNINPKYTQ